MLVGVYILLCSNKRYYIGSTNNFPRRLKEHAMGQVVSIRNVRPLRVVFREAFETLVVARRVERRLKKYKNKNIIERIIKDGHIKGP